MYSPSPLRSKHRLVLAKPSRPLEEESDQSLCQGGSRPSLRPVLPSHPPVYRHQAQSPVRHLSTVPRILPRQPQHVCHHTYRPLTLTSPKPKRPPAKPQHSCSSHRGEKLQVLKSQHLQQISKATGGFPAKSRGEQAVLRRGRAVTDG